MLAASAAEAFDRFERTKNDGLLIRLVRGEHHKEVDGRHLSDILGILGDELRSPSDCPARISPLWLAHAASHLFRGQSHDSAINWGSQFYAELKRLDGAVPFAVIHDWHANVVAPFAIELSARTGPNPWESAAAPKALQCLHARALGGDIFSAEQWHAVLYEGFLQIFAGRVSINLNELNRPKSEPSDKNKIFESPRLAEVNTRAYSDAFAAADAAAYARANLAPTCLGQGFDGYAEAAVTACSILSTHADFIAYRGDSPPYDKYNRISQNVRRDATTTLADGLLQCLARVTS